MSANLLENTATHPTNFVANNRQFLLMCPPKLYEVSYVINPWMQGNLGNSSRRRAVEQWEGLYAALSKLANISLVEPVAGSPDMVFTANAGLARNGVVAISSFYHPERQGEEPHFREWFREAGYRVVDLPRATPFEGEGDALFSVDESRLWVGYGPRTLEASHALCNRFGRMLRWWVCGWLIRASITWILASRLWKMGRCFTIRLRSMKRRCERLKSSIRERSALLCRRRMRWPSRAML